MKKIIAVMLCLALLLLCACNSSPKQYKRISFKSDTLSEEFDYLSENTVVLNKTEETLQSQLPIYEISERIITDDELQLLMESLGFTTNPRRLEHDGNSIWFSLGRKNSSEGYFDMTEEEAIEEAWKIFNKIPFIDGEYECIGIRDTITRIDGEERHIISAGVKFCRLLDGVRVTGNDSCMLTFDGSGLAEFSITLFDYKKVGTMDLVPLEEATAKLRTPDDFDIGTLGEQPYQRVETMQVDRVGLRLINQYSRGCSILQPIYYFSGVATLEDSTQDVFSSKVIAIPESMTYEEE